MSHNTVKINNQYPDRETDYSLSATLPDISLDSSIVAGNTLRYNGKKWISQSANTSSCQFAMIGDGDTSKVFSKSHTGFNVAQGHTLKFYAENPDIRIANATLIYQGQQGSQTRSHSNASDMISGNNYEIKTVGTTDFTQLGAANSNVGTTFTYNGTTVSGDGTVYQYWKIYATNMIEGEKYRIESAGTTDFTQLGASSNTVGTTFTKNSTTATGTGEVSNMWVRGISLPSGTYNILSQYHLDDSTSYFVLRYILKDTSGNELSDIVEIGRAAGEGISSTLNGFFTLSSTTEVRVEVVYATSVLSTDSQGVEASKYGYLFIRRL